MRIGHAMRRLVPPGSLELFLSPERQVHTGVPIAFELEEPLRFLTKL